jgi:hypothetical protein
MLICLVPIEKRGKGIYRHSVAAKVCQPHYESEPTRYGHPTHKGKDKEKELDDQAAEDEDTQLRLLPPVHSTCETPPSFSLSQTRTRPGHQASETPRSQKGGDELVIQFRLTLPAY